MVVKISSKNDNIKPAVKTAFEKYIKEIPNITVVSSDADDGVLLVLVAAVTELVETLFPKQTNDQHWVPVAFQRYNSAEPPNALKDPWGCLVTVYFKSNGNNISIDSIVGGNEKLIDALKKPLEGDPTKLI